MSENKNLVEVQHLQQYFPAGGVGKKKRYIQAVDDVNFAIRKGETLGLVGESGCGKSTLGRQIVALERPTAGRILYRGHDLAAIGRKEMRPIRTELQMVFQDSYSSLNPRKHVYEILAEPMLYHGLVTKEGLDARLRQLLDMVGLPTHALGRYPHEFSGGQRQRIGIARALSLEPKLMVCDEPVSALDVSIQAQIDVYKRQLQYMIRRRYLCLRKGITTRSILRPHSASS